MRKFYVFLFAWVLGCQHNKSFQLNNRERHLSFFALIIFCGGCFWYHSIDNNFDILLHLRGDKYTILIFKKELFQLIH